MSLRTQGCTLGYRIWPPWGFHLALGNGGPIMSFPRYPKYKPSGVEWLGDMPVIPSPNGAPCDSPWQRPGNPMAFSSSPEGAKPPRFHPLNPQRDRLMALHPRPRLRHQPRRSHPLLPRKRIPNPRRHPERPRTRAHRHLKTIFRVVIAPLLFSRFGELL